MTLEHRHAITSRWCYCTKLFPCQYRIDLWHILVSLPLQDIIDDDAADVSISAPLSGARDNSADTSSEEYEADDESYNGDFYY